MRTIEEIIKANNEAENLATTLTLVIECVYEDDKGVESFERQDPRSNNRIDNSGYIPMTLSDGRKLKKFEIKIKPRTLAWR